MMYSDDLALSFAYEVKMSLRYLRMQRDLLAEEATKIATVFSSSYLDKAPSNLCTSADLTLAPL